MQTRETFFYNVTYRVLANYSEPFSGALKILKEMGKKAEYLNPNLKNVEGLLLQKFSFDKQSKGMIMVQMRRYTIAVKVTFIVDDKLCA